MQGAIQQNCAAQRLHALPDGLACRGSAPPFVARPPAAQRTRRRKPVQQPRVQATAAPETAAEIKAPPSRTQHPAALDAVRLSDGVTLLRVSCGARLPEVEFGLRRGTTSNSYLVGGGEVLIDVPSSVLDPQPSLADALGASGAAATVRRLVLTRLNPERLPSLVAALSALRPGVQLLLSNPALQLLRERAAGDAALAAALERVGQFTPITRATELRLANGDRLRFVLIPTPRWPDLVACYSEAERVLFSSNFFSAHVAPPAPGAPALDDGGWGAFGADWRHYFDCMLAPVARQAASALERMSINPAAAGGEPSPLAGLLAPLRPLLRAVNELTLGADDGQMEPLEVETIAPMHGPVVRSAYGNTASLAQGISHGVTKAGLGVETLNLELVGVDEVERVLSTCSGFVIGSPTLGGHMPTQVQTALGAILLNSAARSLPCGVFGSFGWSGEAVDMMEGRLKDAGFKFAFPAIRCKFTPTERTLQECEESGVDLAQEIRRAMKRREKVAAVKLSAAETDTGRAQALGRVVGSLCVLAARDGDASSAMLASWVSQASFAPPGVTVAVKKDRAIEGMLPVGNRFVLNVLAEGKEKGVMRQMLKPFKPGEDRFEGLAVETSEATGAAIIPDSAAYLECTVAGRMEAGDHWVVYATVEGGRVLDDAVESAVHFRRSGSSY
eukprot:scaffold4.g4582.t1